MKPHDISPTLEKLAKLRDPPPVLWWLYITYFLVATVLGTFSFSGWEPPVIVPPPIDFILLLLFTTLVVSSVTLTLVADIAFRILKRKLRQSQEVDGL